MKLNKENLEKFIEQAVQDDTTYIAVVIEMEGFTLPELIINPIENAAEKLEYYKNTYDDELKHKHAPGIKIRKVIAANNLDQIELAYSIIVLEYVVEMAEKELKEIENASR